jgi:hypothetical protein
MHRLKYLSAPILIGPLPLFLYRLQSLRQEVDYAVEQNGPLCGGSVPSVQPLAAQASAPIPLPVAQSERVIAGMLIRVLPSEGEGHCIMLDPGRLRVTAQTVGNAPARPVEFAFVGYRGSDTPATIHTDVTRTSRVFTAMVQGVLYCYNVANRGTVPRGAGFAQITNLDALVSLRMMWQSH